ncbi:MAG: MMPL family transporter [Gemmataceae bacterium]
MQPSYRATAELSPSCSSVRGLKAIQDHFTAGELGPVTVLLEGPADWDTVQGRRVLELLYTGFSLLPNVAEVRCLTHPLGKPIEQPPPPPKPAHNNLRGSLFTALWRNVAQSVSDQINRTARAFYLTRVKDAGSERHVTRLDVVLQSDPFDPRSFDTLERLQLWLDDELPGLAGSMGAVRAEVYGITVSARDLAEVTESDRQRINVLVAGGVFVILLLVVRSPLLAAYLLVTVLLSYYATLGATTLMAHYGYGRPFGEIDWRVPFFLFTILVAVGEDYNILLVSRALEERRRCSGVEAIRRALASTGGTITSCGLIMAGTFATLLLAGLNTLAQIGFALAFGVLLDTFLVRPLLVPAFTVWLWRNERAPALPVERQVPAPRVFRRAA